MRYATFSTEVRIWQTNRARRGCASHVELFTKYSPTKPQLPSRTLNFSRRSGNGRVNCRNPLMTFPPRTIQSIYENQGVLVRYFVFTRHRPACIPDEIRRSWPKS
jgi:hypothetical protein